MPFSSAPCPASWPVPYTVRKSAQARSARLRVRPESGLEVVLPQGMPPDLVPGILERHRAWIERTLTAVCGSASPAPTATLPELLSLHGGRLELPLRWGAGVRRATLQEGLLLLPEQADAVNAGCRRLREWLRAYAKETLERNLLELAAEHSFQVSAVRVRWQKSRWGSCTVRGSISLNICLVFMPDDLCRHVLLHELAHTRHCNHSQAFWKTLFAAEPDALAQDKRLRLAWRHIPAWIWTPAND